MRAALFQGPASTGLPAASSEVAAVAVAAQEAGASILVCSELTLTGYRSPLAPEPRPEGTGRGPIGRLMTETAHACDLAIAYGYAERGRGGEVFDSAAVVGRDGTLRAHYRKTHLYRPAVGTPAGSAPDDTPFTAGDRLVEQFAFGGLTCGILVCYDVEFPEAARAHALAGTDWLLVPTALAQPDDHVATTLVPARAIENQMFLTYVNRVGPVSDAEGAGAAVRYCGRSCAIAPDGVELARAGEGAELLLVDLEPERLERSRRHNRYLRDRRADLYGASDPRRRPDPHDAGRRSR